jgi:RNA polymerase sigma-70 factor (ECF subfamily)
MNREPFPNEATDFSRQMAECREWVVRVAIRLMNGDRAIAEDIAQEVFLRVWNGTDRYQEQGNLRAYLMTITCRLCTDYRRRNHWVTSLEDCHDLTASRHNTTAVAEANEVSQQVQKAIAELSEEQRTVFILSHYEGLRYHEIAEILGCPLGTVASRKYMAVQNLRDKLRPYLQAEENV